MRKKDDPFVLKEAAVRLVEYPGLTWNEPILLPQDAIRLLCSEFCWYDREVLAVINMNSKLRPINYSLVNTGILDQSVTHPKEILKNVFLSNAKGIIFVHNHPSGDITPSKEDIRITDRLSRLCVLAGIELFDHIIVGALRPDRYYSFRERSVLKAKPIHYAETLDELNMKVAE